MLSELPFLLRIITIMAITATNRRTATDKPTYMAMLCSGPWTLTGARRRKYIVYMLMILSSASPYFCNFHLCSFGSYSPDRHTDFHHFLGEDSRTIEFCIACSLHHSWTRSPMESSCHWLNEDGMLCLGSIFFLVMLLWQSTCAFWVTVNFLLYIPQTGSATVFRWRPIAQPISFHSPLPTGLFGTVEMFTWSRPIAPLAPATIN